MKCNGNNYIKGIYDAEILLQMKGSFKIASTSFFSFILFLLTIAF